MQEDREAKEPLRARKREEAGEQERARGMGVRGTQRRTAESTQELDSPVLGHSWSASSHRIDNQRFWSSWFRVGLKHLYLFTHSK